MLYVVGTVYFLGGGVGIERVLVIESSARNISLIDEILEKLKDHPDFEILWLKHEPMLSLPGLEIDQVHRKVYCSDEEVHLTAKEYDLLCLLAANKGRVLTYEQIYRKVWKEEAFGNANNAIKCHIRNLREKICCIRPDAEIVIRCMREVGYCLDVDSEKMAVT